MPVEALKLAVHLTTGLVVVGSFLPLVRRGYWWIRVFDFPRMQLAVLGLVALTGLITVDGSGWRWWLEFALLLAALAHLGLRIVPYCAIYPSQTRSSETRRTDTPRIRLMVANVWMPNRGYHALMSIVDKSDPDIVLLLETDAVWARQLAPLESRYRYRLQQPQDDTYGMLLYSRVELEHTELRFVVEPEVPSFYAQITLSDDVRVRLYALHPRPPRPFEDSFERDAELLIVGREVRQGTLPAIVFGDMNDTAWSHTTRLFQRISGLLDPRVGRGLFNTFHAKIPLLRWPLDHIFHDPGFKLVRLERLGKFGSDHFPMLADLAWEPRRDDREREPSPANADHEETGEKIEKGLQSTDD